jgi:ABC-type lipoprotein release transport system permease subunit
VLLSLALSSLTLVVAASLVASLRSNIERGLRRGLVGDLQVSNAVNPPPQLVEEVPVDFVPIADPDAVTRVLLDDPDVVAVHPRSSASGMLLAEGRSAPAVLVGVDPLQDAESLAALRPGAPGAPLDGALLGRPMAERLHRDGAPREVTALVPTADGLFDGDVFEVAGVYSPPGLPLLDEFIAFVPLDRLQLMLGQEGRPGTLVVRLREGADLAAVVPRLRRAFRGAGLALELRTWSQMAGDLLGIVRIGHYLVASGFAFIMLVVVLGVGNMFLVLMFERTREIGLMRAIGTPRRRILASLLLESVLVSASASAAGALAGGALCGALGKVGIPAASRAMTYAFGGDRFFPGIHAPELLLGFLVVALAGPLAALWPAARASAADPAEVMRTPV